MTTLVLVVGPLQTTIKERKVKMGIGATETWFWRVIGIFALAVCTLNVMVLMRGQPMSNDRLIVEALRKGRDELQNLKVDVKESSKPAKKVPQTKEQKPKADVQKANPPVSAKNEPKPDASTVMKSVKQLPYLDISRVSALYLNPNEIMLLGKKRREKSFLVIGVPTVKRRKAFYLIDTVQGLVSGLSTEEKSEVVIVVFVADFDVEFRNRVSTEMMERFRDEVNAGLIQVIVAPLGYYPSMNNLPLLHGDSVPRVIWRSKQSLDYSFLYFHCADQAQYFLQLEDDVLTEDKYLQHVKNFISSRTGPWSTLEFGARGFIGMMYDAKHLNALAKYTRVNFYLMPVDWLFRVFNDIWLYGNAKGNVRKPPLFKHIGAFSSLDGQKRKLEDLKGAAVLSVNPRVHKDADNPKAHVVSSMNEFVANYPIEQAYGKGNFWGKKVVVGDFILLTFDTPINLHRFVVISGSPTYPSDSLQNGEVFVSAAANGKCDNYRTIFKFVEKTHVDTGVLEVGHPVKCVKLVIDSVRMDDHGRPRWLVIREIDVWVKK